MSDPTTRRSGPVSAPRPVAAPRRIVAAVAGVRIKLSVTQEEDGGTRVSIRVVIPPRP